MRQRRTAIIALVVFLSGCAGAEIMVGSLLLSGGIGYGALSWEQKKMMERVDVRDAVEANFDEVWKAVLATAEEMGITVVDKKLDEKEGQGIFTGKTEKHRKIQIIVGVATPSIVTVGVNAKLKELKPGPLYMPFVGEPEPDCSFAADIINRIRQKCQMVSLVTIMDSNIRAAPTMESGIIAVVKKGTKLERMGKSGNWLNVRLASGKVGYIHKSLLREEGEAR